MNAFSLDHDYFLQLFRLNVIQLNKQYVTKIRGTPRIVLE